MESQSNPRFRNIKVLSLLEEIIEEEILPRLPVKSLLRFRCVSKSWSSLIRNKRFIKTQCQYSMQNPSFLQQRVILYTIGHLPQQCSPQSLLSNKDRIDPPPFDDPGIDSSHSLRFLGSYNGLVCCIYKDTREFYLWNPTTRISKKLPKISNDKCYVRNCGFGWVESSGEYKVVALVYDDWRLPLHTGRVYSSKTKSWKTIEYNLMNPPYTWDTVGEFVGGKVHWRDPINNGIIFLDLKSEVFGRIELPFDEVVVDGIKLLGQIGGCLCVLLCHSRWGDLRVWVKKESWERLVDISLDHELLQRPFSASFIQKGPTGDIFIFNGSTFLVYHPRDNVFRFAKVYRLYDSHHVYVESLVSVEDVCEMAWYVIY